MNITEASAIIATALQQGHIDRNAAASAQQSIRQRDYYGQRMTGQDRERIIRVRFGIN